MLDDSKSDSTRLGRTLRAHPVAIALIGVECGWLAISATGASERLRKQASDASTYARARGKAWMVHLREELIGTVPRTRSSTSRGPHPSETSGYGAVDATGGGIGPLSARQRAGKALAGHPLVTLVLALIAGAAINLALPVSGENKMAAGRIDRPRKPAAT